MTNILEIREQSPEGYYPVFYRGKEYALIAPLQVRSEFERSSFHAYHRQDYHELSIQFVELPPKPKPKPKRRMTDLGLRRPR